MRCQHCCVARSTFVHACEPQKGYMVCDRNLPSLVGRTRFIGRVSPFVKLINCFGCPAGHAELNSLCWVISSLTFADWCAPNRYCQIHITPDMLTVVVVLAKSLCPTKCSALLNKGEVLDISVNFHHILCILCILYLTITELFVICLNLLWIKDVW